MLTNDCAYGAELHFLALRKLPVGKAVFPDVEFAAVAEINADIAAPFMGEFAEFETRQHG